MTLQNNGPISLSDISVETGNAPDYSASLRWVRTSTKPELRQDNGKSSIGRVYGYAYYRKNNEGNCGNGNCVETNCNCGNIQCVNCRIISTVNCTNCDVEAYLQPNCNCACTYNCVTAAITYNCACACACACACGDGGGG
jgi:hypothetical protein